MKYKSVFCTPPIASSLLPVARPTLTHNEIQIGFLYTTHRFVALARCFVAPISLSHGHPDSPRPVASTQMPSHVGRPFLFQLFAFQLPEKTEKKKVEINIENEN
jgi:hypothetical protein